MKKINSLFEWTKKFGDQHYANPNSSTTLCGKPMLGSNYARQLHEKEKDICMECEKVFYAPRKGMMVHILRSPDDSTNGGISMLNDWFVLTGEGMPEIFEPNEKTPELILKRLKDPQGLQDYLYCVPSGETPSDCVGPMMGGNFIYTSDSRFRELSPGPVAVHDRFETQEEYETLSK